jgi:hypothetical protein
MGKPQALTKYPFQKGTQCRKALWLHYFRPECKSPPSPDQQAIMDKGKEVGVIARELFPGGIDVSHNETIYGRKLFQETQKALQSKQQIFYEAAFETLDGRMNCRADIFVRTKRSTKLIEVKSSTSIKTPEHILDLAFQYYVLKNSSYSGPTVEVYIAYLNKEYVRGETIDIDELFVVEDVTKLVMDAQMQIESYLQQFELVLSNDKRCPSDNVSEACFKPYACPFYDHCWKDMPETTVFNISRLRKTKAAEMIEKGIVEPHQIPRDYKLSEAQWIEVDAYRTGKARIDKAAIRNFLTELELHDSTLWMDFESYMAGIPEHIGTRPYQQICFQYCVLERTPAGDLIKREFLAERGKDPRRDFVENLLEDTGGRQPIIVYNEAFEATRLKEFAIEFPEYAVDIKGRLCRLKDLMVPFAKKHYYHPQMKGSYSIKAVMPALLGQELSYDNLRIQNGSMAMSMYERLHHLSLNEQAEIRAALLEYCHLDCLSMVRVTEALCELVNHKSIYHELRPVPR